MTMTKAMEAPAKDQNEPMAPTVAPKKAELKSFTGYGGKGGGMGATGCDSSMSKGKARVEESRRAERSSAKRNY